MMRLFLGLVLLTAAAIQFKHVAEIIQFRSQACWETAYTRGGYCWVVNWCALTMPPVGLKEIDW